MTTLRELYEEVDGKRASYRVVVNGVSISVLEYDVAASFGLARAASFSLANPAAAAFPVQQGDQVEIFSGYNGLLAKRFTGIVTNIAPLATSTSFECTGEGRRLKHTYQRIIRTIAGEDANDVIRNLLDMAGVVNYVVALPLWTIGAAVTGILEFENFGDAVNDIGLVDGSPWYEMATGQIRVELRDPWPGVAHFRQYFSGKLSQLTPAERLQMVNGTLPALALQPPEIVAGGASADARPRIRPDISQTRLYEDVRNRIRIMGAVLDLVDDNGSSTSQRIEGAAQGPSPWIETPPGFRDAVFDFPLIDTQAKADAAAVRQFMLENNLAEQTQIVVDGDPEIELGMTVQVEDPDYSGITGLWFVYGFRERMTMQGLEFSTELDLRGGIRSGVTPLVNPVAEFVTAESGQERVLAQVLPAGSGTIVTFDGRTSYDPDGTIDDYAWSDDQGNSTSGPDKSVVQFGYDESVTEVEMTLTVTDNDGLTDSITKTIHVNNTDPCGNTATSTIFAAIKSHASVSTDGGKTWTDKTKASLGCSGDIVALDVLLHYYVGADAKAAEKVAFFGTTAGELVVTWDAFSTFHKFNLFVPEEIAGIYTFDVFDSGVGEHYDSCFLITVTGRAYFFILRHANNDYGLVNFYTDNQTTTGFVRAYQRGLIFNTGEAVFSDSGAMLLMGGDSGQPGTLIRPLAGPGNVPGTSVGGSFVFAFGGSGNIAPPPLTAELLAAIAAAGSGFKVVGAYHVAERLVSGPLDQSPQFMAIIFDGGVTPRVWYWSTESATWTPATGLTGGVNGKAIAPGFDLGNTVAVLNQLKTFSAVDGVAFAEGAAGAPSQINRVEWELGQKDVYLAAAAGGLVKSLDFGDSWGYIRPHAGVGTTWPGGAEGRAVAIMPSSPPPCAEVFAIGRDDSDVCYLVALSARRWFVVSALAGSAFGLRYFKEGHFLHLQTDGLPRVSSDYGATWTDGAAPDGTHVRCHDVQGDASGDKLWGAWRDGNGSGAGYVIAYSDDFGLTWTTAYNVSTDKIYTIATHPTDPQRLAAAGKFNTSSPFVWVSLDGGGTWTRRAGPGFGSFTSFNDYPRLSVGWLGTTWLSWTPYGRIIWYGGAGGDDCIGYSDDAGVSWTQSTFDVGLDASFPFDLFRVGNFGPFFAIGNNEELAVSVDLGLNWHRLDGPYPDGSGAALAGAAYIPELDIVVFMSASDTISGPAFAALLNPLTNDVFQDWEYNFEDLQAAEMDIGRSRKSIVFVHDPPNPEL